MSRLGNQVLVAGNITKDIKDFGPTQEGGKGHIAFSIAVNPKNDQGNPSFFDVAVYDGRLISDIKRNVTKGSYIVVSGYLNTRKTDSGTGAIIVADSVVISPFMGGMATAFFSGRIVKPIELVTATSGKQFKATSIAVSTKYSDGTEHTDFVNIALSDKLLQSDTSGFEAGDIVSMNGFLHSSSEKKDGKFYTNVGLHIFELPKLIMKAKKNQPAQQTAAQAQPMYQQYAPAQQQQPMYQTAPVQQAQPVYQQPVYQAPVQQAQPMYQQPVAQQQPAYQQPTVQQQPAAQTAPTGMEMSNEQYNALTGGTGFSYDITSDDLPF
jgi:single-stranded DNA-binding protein